MDVMRDHDLKVTFLPEPYGDNRVVMHPTFNA
jgi:hypothetical protein